jgi:hypothetical protein
MSFLLNFLLVFSDLRLLFLLSVIFAWVSIRLRASDDSREKVALALLVISNVFLPIIGGIPALSVNTPIGKSEAVFVWLVLLLALFEVMLRKSRIPLNKSTKKLILAMLIFWGIGFFNAIYSQIEFRPGFFYIPTSLILFAIISPGLDCLPSVHKVFRASLLILFSLMIVKFDFSNNSDSLILVSTVRADQLAYQNDLWFLFGVLERYQGPFEHPNGMGTYVGVMIVVLLTAGEKKLTLDIALGVVLLLLSSSRGSILSTSLIVLMFLLFRVNIKQGRKVFVSTRLILSVPLIFLILSLIYVIRTNSTLTGRTKLWLEYFNLWRESPIFGKGVSLPSVENAYLYTLTSLGIIGFFAIAWVFFNSLNSLPRLVTRESLMPICLFSWICIRSLSEASYTFVGWNSGSLCFLLIALSRNRNSESSQKK